MVSYSFPLLFIIKTLQVKLMRSINASLRNFQNFQEEFSKDIRE